MKTKPKTPLVNVDAAMRRLLAKRHVEAVNGLTSGYMSRLRDRPLLTGPRYRGA